MKRRSARSDEGSAVASPVGRRWYRWAPLAVVALVVALAGAIAAEWVRARHEARREIVARDEAHSDPQVAALVGEINEAVTGMVRLFPHSPQASDVMARLHSRFGSTDDATYWWRRCVEADADFATAYHSLGRLAYDAGRAAEAERLFREAIRREPVSSVYPVQLAEALMHQDKLPEAIATLEENLSRHPNSMPSHALLGQMYVQEGEHARAREHLERAIEMGPDFTNAYYSLAMACANLGEAEKSREYLERFQELKARDEQRHRDELEGGDNLDDVRRSVANLYSAAAQVHIGYGDVATGEEHLLRALELAPTAPQPHEVLAWLYQRQGRADEADELLAALERYAPDDLGGLMTAARLYAEMGRLGDAERVYRRMIELAPHQPGNYALLADVLLREGRRPGEARELALEAVSRDPRATYYALLSAACRQGGDNAAALAAIERALALEPDNAEYQELRAAIRNPWRR